MPDEATRYEFSGARRLCRKWVGRVEKVGQPAKCCIAAFRLVPPVVDAVHFFNTPGPLVTQVCFLSHSAEMSMHTAFSRSRM